MVMQVLELGEFMANVKSAVTIPRYSRNLEADKEEQVNAATKVQAIMRGNSTRKNTPGVAGGKTGKSSFSDDFAEYLKKASEWWKTDVVEGKTMTKVRGLPCLAVRGQDN